MHNFLIFACCAMSYASSNVSEKVAPSIHNGTLIKSVEKSVYKILNRSTHGENDSVTINLDIPLNEKRTSNTPILEHSNSAKDEAQHSLPMLRRIHARIKHSKDAVWATITLTFICVLLVLAVAQSRMWKDHYYKEAQGVPLPNFNERVLFKDVMEHKIMSLKKFFKKKSKEKNTTELESLLPSSEWDN